ncbi:hypothetical protein Bca52824_062592 [Brassica carinata]|uniref:Uncharacterized protein n=1 Tax=Brassica carinata TaxID=52824 RepID=A0A8X7U6W7_BRACI|nr:hypothetical protein Bca52824_062592 [Brassica carinata]
MHIRKQIGQMLMKHHQRNEPPLSPASSLEVAPYNGAIIPGSSLELHGRRRAGEPNYNNLKTSTELLKVLNRIWTLASDRGNRSYTPEMETRSPSQ